MLPLFDAHSHLPSPDIPAPGHPQVVCGTCEADWDSVLAHGATDAQVIPMLGLHPWYAGEASADWASTLQRLVQSHRVGVGECGLDYARQDTDRADQEAVFRAQLRLAHALHRPVAMHVVRAWGPLLEVLREEGVPSAGALVHAYSGSPETARTLQAMGVLLSFSGDLLRPERAKVRESLLAVRPGQLLLETDGEADLLRVLQGAADLLGMSAEDLARQTWENGQRCFRELLA